MSNSAVSYFGKTWRANATVTASNDPSRIGRSTTSAATA
jgi:hypothetical protein